MPNLIHNNEKGMVLPLGLMFLAIIALLGTTAVIVTTTDLKIGSNYKSSVQAFYDAEAGVNYAIAKMESGLKDDSFSLPTVIGNPDDPNDPNSVSLGGFATPSGFFFTFNEPGVSNIATKRYTFTCTGNGPNNAKTVIKADFSPSGLFNYGIFGDFGVTLSGNGKTDSYNSSVGPYTWATHNTEGDVGTNSTNAGAISLSGNAKVYGDAQVGVGGDPDTGVTTSGNAVVNGQKQAADELKDMSPMTDPGGGASETLSLSGNNSKTLGSGTYRLPEISISGNAHGDISGDVTLYVTGNISISGNGRLNILPGGSLTIYVSGTVSISGNGITNSTALPEDLVIYGTSTCTNVSISGNGDIYGAIHAPAADVSVTGNGDIYGSIIGSTMTISGNGNLHYDEALENVGTSSDLKLLSWKQET